MTSKPKQILVRPENLIKIPEVKKKLKLDSIDVMELLFALDMFRGFYLEGRYNDVYSYKERIDEAHWYLDFANLIADGAITRQANVS